MTYEVELGERGHRHVPGGYPEDVAITGLGPCVGVIIYDAESKKSFSIHLVSPNTHEADKLEEMLDEAATEFEESESILVLASGACIGSGLLPAEALEKRSHVGQRLCAYFPRATMNILWPPDGVESTSITLDPENGEFSFEHAPPS
jgi:hypothetical protein